MSDPVTGKYIFYHYDPSTVASVIFVALFAISAILHSYQLFRMRTWYFIPFVIGGLFETIGYVGRALSSKESPDWTLGPYIMQSLLILLAPAFFAASIYMVLGRIILLTDGESCSIIRAKWLTKIFVTGDVLSFLAQSSGGGLLAKSKSSSDVKMGENIITAGLGIQVVFFAVFVVVAGVFHWRISHFPTTRSMELTVPWKRQLWVLYAASALILIRSVFRIVEYVGGQDGVLLSNEIYLYIFDAALMFIMVLILNVFHPGQIISRSKQSVATMDSRDSGYALEEQNVRPSKY